jgi:hypothetical protein
MQCSHQGTSFHFVSLENINPNPNGFVSKTPADGLLVDIDFFFDQHCN